MKKTIIPMIATFLISGVMYLLDIYSASPFELILLYYVLRLDYICNSKN